MIFSTQLFAISIDRLKDNSQRYNGDIVRLRGYVTFRAGIPFTDLLVYTLEDKTGSILVFSVYPKERDERVSIKAEVVSYDGEENEAQRLEVINKITDYLVDKEIMERSNARKVSEVSLKIINSAANAITGTWFVIEQEKSGFINL